MNILAFASLTLLFISLHRLRSVIRQKNSFQQKKLICLRFTTIFQIFSVTMKIIFDRF